MATSEQAFLSVALVPFSDRHLNAQNYLFNFHVISLYYFRKSKNHFIFFYFFKLLWCVHAKDHVQFSLDHFVNSFSLVHQMYDNPLKQVWATGGPWPHYEWGPFPWKIWGNQDEGEKKSQINRGKKIKNMNKYCKNKSTVPYLNRVWLDTGRLKAVTWFCSSLLTVTGVEFNVFSWLFHHLLNKYCENGIKCHIFSRDYMRSKTWVENCLARMVETKWQLLFVCCLFILPYSF